MTISKICIACGLKKANSRRITIRLKIIPETEYAKIIYLRKAGKTQSEIASLYGVSQTTISKICIAFGLKEDLRNYLPAEQKKRIKKMIISGYSTKKICSLIGCSLISVHRIKENLKLVKNKKRKRYGILDKKTVKAILEDINQSKPKSDLDFRIIGERHGVSYQSVKKVQRLGLDAVRTAKRLTPVELQKLYQSFHNEERNKDIVNKFNISPMVVSYHKKRYLQGKGLLICAATNCNNTFIPRYDGRPRSYCCTNCRDREKHRRYREQHAKAGRCPHCHSEWIEPEETHRGKPKHCKRCQEYYRNYYRDRKSQG